MTLRAFNIACSTRSRAFALCSALLLMAAACKSSGNALPYDPDRAGNGAAGAGTDTTTGSDGAPVDCATVTGAPRRLWRLSPAQYDNTVHDLFQLTGTWGEGFPADTVVNGFANNAEALLVTPLWADKAAAAAEDIASQADLSQFSPCKASAGTPDCLQQFVTKLGERAFRRPLTAAQSARYIKLAGLASDFETGQRLVITAMLQSPNFLYRRELGVAMQDDRYALDDFEIASELSYMAWQSMPDATLFDAARSGKLHTSAQIDAQLARMLKDDRARPMVKRFVVEWLDLYAISTIPKDMGTFPNLDDGVRTSMLKEVEHFVDYVMFQQGGSLTALLTSPTTFLDDTLAKFYGTTVGKAAADADGMHETTLPDQQRAGILTLGGVMLRHARSNDSSPVLRGKLVRERFLCQIPPPPPPGIVVQPPPLDPTKTARERYAAHSVMQPCAGCHRLMDRIGFAFEHFDGVGRFRAQDNGQPIDVTGDIEASLHTDGDFSGTAELSQKLAQSEEVQSCFSRQWLRFAYGMDEDGRGLCIQQRVQASIGTDATLQDMIHKSVGDEQFLIRVAAVSGDTDAGTSTTHDAGTTNGSGGAGTSAVANDAGLATDAGNAPVTNAAQLAEVINDNDYGTGYCDTYQVTNQGDSMLSWSVSVDLGGTLSQHWESNVTANTGKVVFTGVDYNATLMPKSSTQFGFCVTR